MTWILIRKHNVGAGNGHNVGLRIVFQGDGGRRAAGAAAHEIAAGNTAGKHFGDKVLGVAVAKYRVHVGGRFKGNGLVQGTPVGANDAHTNAIQGASQFTAAFRRQYGMTPAKYRKDV